ncbi:MAG: hypothetical protein ACK4LB_05555 [Spirosomataceae bacterium]
MKTKLSKIQEITYEKGEYSHAQLRTWDETLELIHQFPWHDQRYGLNVGFTCPSITMEENQDIYLKIGLYFSGKFVVYFLNQGKVYEKPIANLEDFTPYLQHFFDQNWEALQKVGDKMSFVFNPYTSFRTHPFRYSVHWRGMVRLSRMPGIFTLVIFLLFSIPLSLLYPPSIHLYNLVSWTLLNLGNFVLLANYYRADLRKVLILSKGQDTFWFGTDEQLVTYSKKDILYIKAYQNTEYRSLWHSYSIYEIGFSNGDVLYFSTLLLSESDVQNKFEGWDIEIVSRYFPRYAG